MHGLRLQLVLRQRLLLSMHAQTSVLPSGSSGSSSGASHSNSVAQLSGAEEGWARDADEQVNEGARGTGEEQQPRLGGGVGQMGVGISPRKRQLQRRRQRQELLQELLQRLQQQEQERGLDAVEHVANQPRLWLWRYCAKVRDQHRADVCASQTLHGCVACMCAHNPGQRARGPGAADSGS